MSDTTARDQLAELLADDWNPDRDPILTAMFRDYAQTILEAGWRPPARTATTWEEVQSLREGALILIDRRGRPRVYERQEDDAWPLHGGGWLDEDWLPATIIWEPEEVEG